MKVAGFTIIRNAIKFDYPVKEAILSVLPLCDVFVVAVGQSEDETRQLIESIGSEKIRIIDTIWDDSLREGGRVLAVETDKAYAAVPDDCDWCFYIQGDEILHEKFHDILHKSMSKWKDDPEVEGLLFDYLHFYGSYDFVADSRGWYGNEVRIIRKDPEITSYRDAIGFRKSGKHLNVVRSGAEIYHYGWVKHPKYQQLKQLNFNKFWHDDQWVKENVDQVEEFDYSKIDSLAHFHGNHPKVMQDRIKMVNWKFNFDPTKKKLSLKKRILKFLKDKLGISIGEYKNYRLLRK